MPGSANVDCAALLAHAGWVRALARHLAEDADDGDDLAQEALARALVRPAPAGLPLRSWLAGILRNLARHERRSAGRRGARERAAARPEIEGIEDGGSAGAELPDLLGRLEVHRAVVDAVAALEEPYRTVILLRYFEGLPPAAIAARTAAPLRTVHTRLHRALGQLRTALDRRHAGDRSAWVVAVLPIARGAEFVPTAGAAPGAPVATSTGLGTIGALIMDAKLKIAVAVAVLAGLGTTWVLRSGDAAEVDPAGGGLDTTAMAAAEPDATERAAEIESAAAGPARRAAERPAVPETSAASSAAASTLRGRVIDLQHTPVAGVRVRFTGAQESGAARLEALTDGAGAFELDDPRAAGRLDLASPGWTSLFRPELQERAPAREHVIVAARCIALAGIVVDERHAPLAAASVRIALPWGVRARFDAVLDRSSVVEPEARTGADGRFELAGVPLVQGAKLVTAHAKCLDDERALPERDEQALEIVLRSATQAPTRLVGTVVDAAGAPVEDAWVALGPASTQSGPEGAFVLELEREGETADGATTKSLRAAKAGHLPAEIAAPADHAWPDPLVLRLGGPALAIEGRIVDAEGAPVAQALVWTDEETRFGYVEIEGGEMKMKAGATIEGVLRNAPFDRHTRARPDGGFRLAGLLARDYAVQALDRKSLRIATATFAAGTKGVELRLPAEPLHERVAGRITDLAGTPVGDLRVTLARKLEGGAEHHYRLETLPVETRADGEFAFEGIARSNVTVIVTGAELDLMGFERPLEPGEDVEHLVLAVPLRVRVQVDGREQTEFDKVGLLDAQGEKLYLSVYHGKSSYAMREVELVEGRTEPFSVSELAKTLVLYKGAVEVRRVPVTLVRGEMNSIRP